MIITIDGPSGTGKTTIAKGIAKALGINHFDTGAMYRSFTWYLIHLNILSIEKYPQEVEDALKSFQFSIEQSQDEKRYIVNGIDVSSKIRTPEVTQYSSSVATLPNLRKHLVSIQREFGKDHDAIFEGRDLGSVVFPQASFKFFLTASPEVRAHRRFVEMETKSTTTLSEEEILKNQQERDQKDMTRQHSPLVIPEGAIEVDTSELSIDAILQKILGIIASNI